MKAAVAMNSEVMIGCTNFLSDLYNLRGSCVVLRRFARFPSLFVVLVDHFPKLNSVFRILPQFRRHLDTKIHVILPL